jgi:hypothetical protein
MTRRLTMTLMAAALITWLVAMRTAGPGVSRDVPNSGDADNNDSSVDVQQQGAALGRGAERTWSSSTAASTLHARVSPLAQQRHDPDREHAYAGAGAFDAERLAHGALGERHPTRMVSAPPGATVDPIAESANDQPSGTPLPSEAAVTGQIEHASALASAWNREPPDPARTRQMDAYLRESAQAAHLDPRLVKDTDCGASACRVTLSFARVDDALAFQQAQSSDFRYAIITPARPPIEANLGSASAENALSGVPPTDTRQSAESSSPAANPRADGDAPLRIPEGTKSTGERSLELEILLASKNASAQK